MSLKNHQDKDQDKALIGKRLVIAPHLDDDVLGCGGILNKSFHVYFCGIDESLIAPDKDHRIPMEGKEEELREVSEFLGFSYEVNYKSKENYFKIQEFITWIEEVINKVKPEIIFIPHPGYNQDHQVIFNACQVALRHHDKNHFVKKVLVYEAIHDFLWSYEKFSPSLFVPIDIDRKIRSYELYRSQVRSFRSSEMLKNLAKARGMMANVPYAEAFQVLRWVDDLE
jgi:LmbE family N-acetylglucosaminyl deacetylase